jgi:hypothetical protein
MYVVPDAQGSACQSTVRAYPEPMERLRRASGGTTTTVSRPLFYFRNRDGKTFAVARFWSSPSSG